MKVQTIYGKLLVKDKEEATILGGIIYSVDGYNNTIDAEVISVGGDITDIKAGDVITYQKSRGNRINYEEVDYNIVDYGSVLLFKN